MGDEQPGVDPRTRHPGPGQRPSRLIERLAERRPLEADHASSASRVA